MSNKTPELIAKENETVSDEELKDVSGGNTVWVELDTFGATFQAGGFVMHKAIDGSKCPNCGGIIGVISHNPDGSQSLKCVECGGIIQKNYRSEATEIL